MEVSILQSITHQHKIETEQVKNNKRMLLLSQMTKINDWISLYNL